MHVPASYLSRTVNKSLEQLQVSYKYVKWARQPLPFRRRVLRKRSRFQFCYKAVRLLRYCSSRRGVPRVATLLPHQRTALTELYSQRSRVVALHMVMGSGKTRVALEYFAGTGPVLYVTLPALVPQVQAQLLEYLSSRLAQNFEVVSQVPAGQLPARVILDEYPTFVRTKTWSRLSQADARVLLLTGELDSYNTFERHRQRLGPVSLVRVTVADGVLREPLHFNVPLELHCSQRSRYEDFSREAAQTPSFQALQRHRAEVSRWKIPEVVQFLANCTGAFKGAVFSEFNSSLLELACALSSTQWTVFKSFGCSVGQRHGELLRFQRETGPAVLLCSVRAGARGLNLGHVTVLVLLEGVYGSSDLRQTCARLVRVNQTRALQRVVQFYFRGTFEERLVRANSAYALSSAQLPNR